MYELTHKTARYRILVGAGGNRYRFFCARSDAAVCTTSPIRADTEEEALRIAWETEGRAHFNQCARCGQWVCNAMYNADVLECVDCAPWEEAPRFCPACGVRVAAGETHCRKCGVQLRYGAIKYHGSE